MEKVINQLKVVQASSLVMFTKLHNYHWNITGMQFFPIHEMTEKIYGEFNTLYDDAAERVLQLGDKPLVLLNEISAKSVINEEKNSNFEAQYVLENILEDFKTFLKEFEVLSELASEAGDNVTVAFADENTAHLEKNIWMISASLK